MADLAVRETIIPGFYEIDLVLHGDNRGWFKENYQKEKLEALGLPSFDIVQNNFSFNRERGATRGLHAEPWEKFISLANGKVFCAWVDLRKGDSFGKTLTLELTPEKAVFVPADSKYAAVNLFDPALGIDWPIPKDEAIVSEKDRHNPLLADVTPMEI
jgi:dTDP-4-dehydrorhamnose 3,5-epimerase